MNSSGFIRGLMSKNYESEKFMLHVGQMIENQLKEWDEEYWINIMKMKDYVFVVKKGEEDYWLEISEAELAELQGRSPYSLDKKIWLAIEQQGIEIKFGYGDYLEKVLGRQ